MTEARHRRSRRLPVVGPPPGGTPVPPDLTRPHATTPDHLVGCRSDRVAGVASGRAVGFPVHSPSLRRSARTRVPGATCGGLSSTGRASDCGSEGYGFKPRRPPHLPVQTAAPDGTERHPDAARWMSAWLSAQLRAEQLVHAIGDLAAAAGYEMTIGVRRLGNGAVGRRRSARATSSPGSACTGGARRPTPCSSSSGRAAARSRNSGSIRRPEGLQREAGHMSAACVARLRCRPARVPAWRDPVSRRWWAARP